MGLSPADLDRLVDRLRGFTTFEAERAITQAILRDNTLDARDIDLVVEIKKDVTRAETIDALREWARDRTVMVS